MADPRRDGAILLARNADGNHWQLGRLPPRDGALTLLGWTLVDPDGGIPAPVVAALARAFVHYGRVTFLCSQAPRPGSHGWHPFGDDFVAVVPQATRSWQAAVRAPGGFAELRMVSTLRELVVRDLFDDAVYPWWYQGQFVLLSRPTNAVPDFGAIESAAPALIGPDWLTVLSRLRSAGVEAVVRPGVDGDVAGLHGTSPAVCREVEEAIAQAASDLGLACRELSENEFAEALAIR